MSRATDLSPEPSSTASDRGGNNALRGDLCTSDKPFHFSVALPEGNYSVRVTFGDAAGETVTTVKAELRRLMVERVQTARGEFATRTFTVNVRRPEIAGGGEVKLKDREKTTEMWAWDEKLTLEFNNTRPSVCAIEITRVDSQSDNLFARRLNRVRPTAGALQQLGPDADPVFQAWRWRLRITLSPASRLRSSLARIGSTKF